MLGDPEPPESEPLGVPGQVDRRVQRVAGVPAVRHRGQVEDRERYLLRTKGESIVHDFPAGGWRMKEPAEGIMATIVNGQVLMENGKHTGALPGRVLRNTYYHANHA